MKLSQLFFDFTRKAAQVLSGTKPARPAREKGTRRDAELEAICAKKLAAAGCNDLAVKVVWSRRLTTTAGFAAWRTRTITLNAALKELPLELSADRPSAISQEHIERTLLHELAHLLAQHRAGERRIPPHGTAWRRACRDLGIADETRCHNLPFERKRRERKFFYRCPHCAQTIARVRPMRGANACYDCCRKFNRGRYDDRFRLRLVPQN